MRHRDEVTLPRKLTVRAHGRKLVLAKRTWESERHVLLKALVFGLYVPWYPNLFVERSIGHRYTPDLVALDSQGDPVFWAECGETARNKLAHLVRSFPTTHLVVANQGSSLVPLAEIVGSAVPAKGRTAPIELLNFPDDAVRYFGQDGEIDVTFTDGEVVRL